MLKPTGYSITDTRFGDVRIEVDSEGDLAIDTDSTTIYIAKESLADFVKVVKELTGE